VKGANKLGTRLGNWLTCAQGRRLLEAPDKQDTEGKRDHAILALLLGSSTQDKPSSPLSRLKDGKAIGVVDEDAPEEPRRQDAVDPLETGILLDAGETEEGYA